MRLDHRSEDLHRALIRAELDFFSPELTGSVGVEDYLRDWAQVMLLARFDRLLPEQGLYYPLVPAVSGLDPSAEQVLTKRLQDVLDAVERVADHYQGDVELQRFLNVPKVLHEYALADQSTGRRVDYCRFDLAGDRLDDVRVFEVGGDGPGQSNTSGLLNKYWRQTSTVGPLVEGYGASRIEEPGWLITELLKLGARRGVDLADADRIAIFCLEEVHALPELLLIADQVRHHGRTPLCVMADAPEASDTRLGLLMCANLPIVETPERFVGLLERVVDGRITIFNGVLGRAIGGNKLTLAVLSDPRFRSLFTDSQINSIDAIVPWSRKLDDGVTINETRAQQADVVLKAPFDALSRSVHVGRELSVDRWRHLVEVGAREGWLVQEFVPSQCIDTEAGAFHRTLGAPFLAGRAVGYSARLSTTLRGLFTPGDGMHAVFGGDHAHDVAPPIST